MKPTSPELPYELVEFPSDSGAGRRSVGGHHRLAGDADRISGRLELELKTLRPVQVASGRTDFVKPAGGREQLALREVSILKYGSGTPPQPQRVPVLPGSSLKGVVRSLVEIISPSCMMVMDFRVRKVLPRGLGRCAEPGSLCPACRLFGTQDYQGQVGFVDAEVPPDSLQLLGTPMLWTPARSRGRNLPSGYLKNGRARGRKVYRHSLLAKGPDPRVAIKPGVNIPAQLFLENLVPEEMGLLLAALGLHPGYKFPIKIGAGKPVGMGSIEVSLKRVQVFRGPLSLKQSGRWGGSRQKLSSSELQEHVRAWIRTAEETKLLLPRSLAALAEVLSMDNLDQPPALYGGRQP